MKAAVIIFHRDIGKYPVSWVDQCFASVRDQTFKNFDVFEFDYGGTFCHSYYKSTFDSFELLTHAHAHNHLLDWVFSMDYDCAFNVNIDDYYALDRFEKQTVAIRDGADVVSSNFIRFNHEGQPNVRYLEFHKLDPVKEAKKGHNIIAHPVCCYSRKFWLNCTRLNPAEIPQDDFELWKRSYGKFNFVILPDYLLYQRIHEFNISKK